MSTIARGIRLKESLDREIATEAERTGISRSAATVELIDEAIRLRRAPGISIVDGPTGRRAVIAGTGLEVWEIIDAYQQDELSFEELEEEFSWLSQMQLRAALGYYALYPEEVDARLEQERAWTPERVAAELPFAMPRRQLASSSH